MTQHTDNYFCHVMIACMDIIKGVEWQNVLSDNRKKNFIVTSISRAKTEMNNIQLPNDCWKQKLAGWIFYHTVDQLSQNIPNYILEPTSLGLYCFSFPIYFYGKQ